ncbi:MAG: type II toxin-antitoxin system VapB family antitoxin [Caldilineaceae bacterium]|nr:type II toxin-antitoxin system VapB family antitoxin [Caldilineaceae bacterium]HRJ42920.1 type II toxin-antitoxin system VapB family antitoxin [Caldilineaceae bacterium]
METTVKYYNFDELAQELATYTGESVGDAVTIAVRERLRRVQTQRKIAPKLHETLLRIGRECAALPVLDNRIPDEIIGYDERGVPV